MPLNYLLNGKVKMKEKLTLNKYILYLDTSEPEAVIAIYDGDKLLTEKRWEGYRELSITLSKKYLGLLREAKIKQNDLLGICVFTGPGSFTGLRIGISFANGLSYGLGIPVYETTKKGKLNFNSPKKVVVPRYGSEPKITKSKK
jgi:tRNA threonylcarbamoyladenosine biosynthesis protein TsaB